MAYAYVTPTTSKDGSFPDKTLINLTLCEAFFEKENITYINFTGEGISVKEKIEDIIKNAFELET